ncbi:MAG: FprA family A-type flavoprotein [Bacteroidaceae bacterium]|nr:FprA family A-type flavoprotein [Bacteroidaceae bacterium]
MKKITDSILYVGVDDADLDLFEGQYVVPEGMCYNSYVILDNKTVVMDSVDSRKGDEWLANVREALAGRSADYLVVQHMEPDHSGTIAQLVEAYPGITIVGNARTFDMLKAFTGIDAPNKLVIKEGDTLTTGAHTLTFIMAPMVHWPEVFVTYDSADKALFSADAFGKFGVIDADKDDWTCEARRYYFNICGKYGVQVQALLRKMTALDVQRILPLHGPLLESNLDFYVGKYDVWSSYAPEDKGVLVAYASIHGNTARVAQEIASRLEAKGIKVATTDLSRDDQAEAIEDAFRYDRMVVAASSYDGGIFPPMYDFLIHLKWKNYQKRRVAIVENGSWAPVAGKRMAEMIAELKDVTLVGDILTIRSAMKPTDEPALAALVEAVAGA